MIADIIKPMRLPTSPSLPTRSGPWLLLPVTALAALLAGCLGHGPGEHAAVAAKEAALGKAAGSAEEAEKPLAGNAKAFGIYQWNKDSTYQSGLESEINALGTSPTYAMYFVDRDMGFPKDIVAFNSRRGIKSVLSQELVRYSNHDDIHTLDSILAGRWDGYFRRFAKDARASRDVIYYRFGYEMNGAWQAWGEQPDKFTKAWRRAWKIFKEEKADNVRWVFSANVIWGEKTVKDDLLAYYPGAKYVDVVGLDGYNFGDNHSRYHRWKSYADVFRISLDALKRNYPDKPLWITEIGCAEGPGKAEWIQDFFAHFNADPAIRVFVWFNEDKQYAGEPNWRFDSDKDSAERFRNWAIYNNSITMFSLPMAGREAAMLASPADAAAAASVRL
jgi:mannan endo-1,4-beta-mannosidase